MWIWLLLVLLPPVRADAEFWLSAPEDHVALTGAIEVSFRLPVRNTNLRLLLVRLDGDDAKPVAKRDVPAKLTKGKVVFSCDLFSRAGQFLFKLVTLDKETELFRTKIINVRWPEVIVHVPLMVETYTSDVSIQLYNENLQCKPRLTYNTFADLVYEGFSITTWHKPSILTSKELTGWTWDASYELTLECEFFDRAGNYTVHVRTNLEDAPEIAISDTILVMWSHRYSVSVAKSSVQPCDGSLSVIYHYPRCILDQDRIRVYGKALRGPLKYIRESRIETGKHSTKLSCDIFQDDYQEYCFSFVSTARNGAVFDLKTHCLPTLTDSKELSAIWNDWGPWSECSASCGTGIQSRYRLCLTATNESYCIGKAVQSQQCNTESCADNVTTTTEQPEIWDCACGCERNITDISLIHLVISECDSDVWWSIQAWPNGHIIIEVISLVFPATDCWLTIRDGKSSLGTVLAIFTPLATHQDVHSLSDTVRIEVHCGNISSDKIELVCRFTRSEIPRASLAMVRHSTDNSVSSDLSAVHITIIMLAAVLCTTTAFLVLIHSYRRYISKSSSGSSTHDCPDLVTSTSEISMKTPSASPEDYLYKSFIFRSSTSLQPKLKWDKLPDTSSPVRRRGRPTPKTVHRESATPLAASVSELSMTGSEDGFEYDYYDYGCHQEPGSFFCPDPVLMGWPPFIPLPPQGTEEFGDYPLQHFTPSPDNS